MKRESRLPASPTAYRHHGARAGGARRRRRRPSVGDVPSILGRPFFRGRAVSALGHDLGQTNEHENKARRGAGGKRTSKINDLCRGWQPARRGTTAERAGPTAPTGRGRVGAPGAPQSTARPVMVNGTHRLRLQFMLGFSAHSPLKSCGASLRHFGTVYRLPRTPTTLSQTSHQHPCPRCWCRRTVRCIFLCYIEQAINIIIFMAELQCTFEWCCGSSNMGIVPCTKSIVTMQCIGWGVLQWSWQMAGDEIFECLLHFRNDSRFRGAC